MKNNIKTYALRPHHGMCLAFFIGEGYSDTFTRNMGRMLGLLEEGAQVRLAAGCDEICKACPNRKQGGGVMDGGSAKEKENHAEKKGAAACGDAHNKDEMYACASEEKVRGYDEAVLAACGLEEGVKMSFGDFTALVQEKIISPGARAQICKDCRWNDLCERTKSRWQQT